MLLGFYQPESGEITIGGTELSCISKSLLRKKISYMTQEIFLFADTIKNNICCNFGSLGSDVSDVKLRRATTKSARSLHCDPSAQSANLAYPTERPDQLDSPNPQSSDLIEGCAGYKNDDDELSHFKEVCRICGVDDFVSKMPFGYGTRLDESGSNLSGGQRQRIALARALLRNPDIMVLDEATSSLDSATEKSVTGSLLAATKDKTCIIITHRSSTIAQCDWVIAIENGKIVKQGTPNEFISEVV
jgi:ABC-type bacteriocin/lantibiotic exporter with double-glycine peptidase domain